MKKSILDGKWKSFGNKTFTVIIKGNTYTSFYNGFRYGKGKIEYEDGNFTLTSTHARHYIFWVPFVEIVNGKYNRVVDEVTIISGIDGRYYDLNGRWIKKK